MRQPRAGARDRADPLPEPHRALGQPRRRASTSASMPPASVTKRLQRAPLAARRRARPAARARHMPRIRLRSRAPSRGSAAWWRRGCSVVGVGGVDAADQRLRDALERLAPEPAARRTRQALVAGRRRAAAPGRAPCAACPATRRAARRRAAGAASAPGAGSPRAAGAAGPPCTTNVRRTPSSVPTAATRAPRRRQSCERPRLLGDERVRPGLDEEAVACARCAIVPPRRSLRLEQRQLERPTRARAQLDGAVGGGEPGDAAADDDELTRPGPASPACAHQVGEHAR